MTRHLNSKFQHSPLVSVIIPAFAHAQYIREAIESILNQTFEDFELIIIDDASPDATPDLIRQFTDNRLRTYFHSQNQGSAETLNHGLKLARGRFISILNSDDLYQNNRLHELLNVMAQTNAWFLATDIELIDRASQVITNDDHWWLRRYQSIKAVYQESHDLIRTFLTGNLFATTSNFFFDRQILSHVGNLNSYRYIQDYEFLLRCLVVFEEKVVWIPEKMLLYRLHGENTILENAREGHRQTIRMLLDKLPDFAPNGTTSRRLIALKDHLQTIITDLEAAAVDDEHKRLTHITDPHVQCLEAEIIGLKEELEMVYHSKTFRLGHMFIHPMRKLFSMFNLFP